MKVLWVSDSPLLGTGFGRVTREVTGRLMATAGFEVACLGWSHDGWPQGTSGYPGMIYPSSGPTFGQDNFERAILEFRPEVVVTLGELWMLDWLPRHPTRPRFKWIAYVPIDGGPFYPPWESILRDADQVVAMSAFGHDILSSGLTGRDIPIIHHGVDASVFRPLPERSSLKAHERLKGRFVVGCVARNQPRKNLPALVKAFAILARKMDHVHLLLHTNPCDVGYDIVTLLRRYRLEGRADVSSPDVGVEQPMADVVLNRLYNLFDVMVLPSAAEGFGLPIIESCAAGVPVIATDCSACTELVRGHGELARVQATLTVGVNLIDYAIVDVDDLAAKIEKLIAQPAVAKEYADRAYAFAQTLDWTRLMPKWTEVIGYAVGGGVIS